MRATEWIPWKGMLFAVTLMLGLLPPELWMASLLYGDQIWPVVNDSMLSRATTPATATTCHQRIFGSNRPTRPPPAITPHGAGGWSMKDRPETSVMPALLPRTSSP